MKNSICIALALAASSVFAQGHGNPPPDAMKSLSFLEGTWTGQQNFNNPGNPLVADITLKAHMFAAGRFMEEELHTKMPGAAKATEVHHFISFDPKTSEFHAWWFNDTSNMPSELTGTLSGNTLVMMSHPTNPKAPVMRATYEKVSDSSLKYKLEMKMGDSWQELFHNSYTKSAE